MMSAQPPIDAVIGRIRACLRSRSPEPTTNRSASAWILGAGTSVAATLASLVAQGKTHGVIVPVTTETPRGAFRTWAKVQDAEGSPARLWGWLRNAARGFGEVPEASVLARRQEQLRCDIAREPNAEARKKIKAEHRAHKCAVSIEYHTMLPRGEDSPSPVLSPESRDCYSWDQVLAILERLDDPLVYACETMQQQPASAPPDTLEWFSENREYSQDRPGDGFTPLVMRRLEGAVYFVVKTAEVAGPQTPDGVPALRKEAAKQFEEVTRQLWTCPERLDRMHEAALIEVCLAGTADEQIWRSCLCESVLQAIAPNLFEYQRRVHDDLCISADLRPDSTVRIVVEALEWLIDWVTLQSAAPAATTQKEPGSGDDARYSVGEVCRMTGFRNHQTLNRYAKKAQVPTAGRGKQDHRFHPEQVVKILQKIIDSSVDTVILTQCRASLDRMKELRQKGADAPQKNPAV